MRHRSAKTGHFVTKEFAEANPDTTVSEQDFDLNKALKAISDRITEDQRKENEQFQKDMRAGLGSRLDPNSLEQRVLRAQEREIALLKQISILAQAEDSELRQNRLYQSLCSLADALAEQGKYSEAVDVCPNDEKKAEYQLIAQAIERDDAASCQCGPEQIKHGNTVFEQGMGLPVLSVVSLKHGTPVMLTICRNCGFAQAK